MRTFFVLFSFFLLSLPLYAEEGIKQGDTQIPPTNGDGSGKEPIMPSMVPIMKTVKEYFNREEYLAADKSVDGALAINDVDYEAVKYKGMIALKLDNLEDAKKYLKSALTADNPNDPELIFYCGALFFKLKNYIIFLINLG